MAYHYDTDSKKEARALLLHHARGTNIKRIFTLPSVDGFCAREFRGAYPNSHIVGIERDELAVLHSDLIKGDGVEEDRQCMDELYIGNVSDMVGGGVLRKRKWRKNKSLDQGRAPIPCSVKVDFKPFDLIYLDFTAQPNEKIRSLVNNFLVKFARKGSIVGLTLVMNRKDDREATDLYPQAYYHSYLNARSRMGLLIWKHS